MEVRNCWYHWVNVVHRTEDLRGFERSQSFSADDHSSILSARGSKADLTTPRSDSRFALGSRHRIGLG